MADSLPPDPYIALGVPKDASAATIKTQYRKLALKFHPDKVQDASQKELAADQFHKIQTAWEIVGNEARRQRYDAQCRLVELRKDVLAREGAARRGQPPPPPSYAEPRSAKGQQRYPPPPSSRDGDYFSRGGPERSARGVSPVAYYEERRPSYAAEQDYYDAPPRATSRKEPEYERSSSKRTPPRNERERSKLSQKEAKEAERSRQKEKSKQSKKDIRRDRDRKQQVPVYASPEEMSSDSDGYERERARRMRRREEEEREDQDRAREFYREQARRQYAEASAGQYTDRARKLFSQEDSARDHIKQSTARRSSRQRPESSRRPSPVRMNSSKDRVEHISRDGRPSITIRRGSGHRPSTADGPRRSSGRNGSVVDEPEGIFRPPGMFTSKSSPTDIRMPFDQQQQQQQQQQSQRTRSQSAQLNADPMGGMPKMRRADSMPVHPTSERPSTREREPRRRETTRPTKSSGLSGSPQHAYPTPEHSPEPPPPMSGRRYRYGQHEYADDTEFPTPDGYRTEPREQQRSNVEFRPMRYRSPSPIMREEPTPRPRAQRANSTAYQPQTSTPVRPSAQRTTSTSYVYTDSPRGNSGDAYNNASATATAAAAAAATSPSTATRPSGPKREPSSSASRANLLYGELPTLATPGSRRVSPHTRAPSSPAAYSPTTSVPMSSSMADAEAFYGGGSGRRETGGRGVLAEEIKFRTGTGAAGQGGYYADVSARPARARRGSSAVHHQRQAGYAGGGGRSVYVK